MSEQNKLTPEDWERQRKHNGTPKINRLLDHIQAIEVDHAYTRDTARKLQAEKMWYVNRSQQLETKIAALEAEIAAIKGYIYRCFKGDAVFNPAVFNGVLSAAIQSGEEKK